MAVFNPQVNPTNDPNYTGISKPISDVTPDKSTAIAITGGAEALGSAVSLVEQTAQDYIKEKTRAGIEALRGATTVAYEDIRNAQATGAQPSPLAQRTAGFTGSLVAGAGDPDTPPALQAGLDRAGDIATARAQGSVKANDTLYTGALNSLAKQLRNEFPGHRDFIDEQIAKISGKNPANAYMDNLLQDIRSSATKTDAFENKILSLASSNFGAPDVKMYWEAYRAKLPGSFQNLTDAVYRAEKDKYTYQMHTNQSTENKTDLEADAGLAKTQYQQRSASAVFRNFNPVIEIPGFTSPAMQQKLLDEYRQGLPSSIKQEQWDQMLLNAQRARDVADNELKDIANNGGYAKRIRDPEAEKAIRNNELTYFDNQIKAISSKDVGTMFDLQRRAKGMEDNAKYQVYSDANMGDFFLKGKIVRENLPDQWSSFLTQQALSKGHLGRFQNWFSDTQMKIGVPDDVRKDGVAKSMTADIIQAKRAEKDANAKPPSRLYDDLVENVNLITKAQEMGQENIAKEAVKYSFDPARNSKLLNQFGRDFTDDNGVFHKGKFAYYDVMSKPKIVDSVFALKDKDSWDMMKNWQEVSFKTLFGEEVKTLNGIQGDKSLPVKLRWEGNQIVPEFPKATTNVEANYMDAARKSINDLNRGLSNLAYMHGKEADPNQTSAYLFDVLNQLGYSPNDRLHGDNLPQRVIEAIAASVKPKPTSAGAMKAAE